MPKEVSEIWRHAKRILLPYEGMAAQLYVLDVPLRFLPDILDIFSKAVSEPMVTLNGQTREPRPLNLEVREALLADTTNNRSHHLQGVMPGREALSMFVWVDSKNETLDVELVFWSDQLFPQPDDESACVAKFGLYLSLAEAIRAGAPAARCVLSASEAGDPREEIGKPWTYCW